MNKKILSSQQKERIVLIEQSFNDALKRIQTLQESIAKQILYCDQFRGDKKNLLEARNIIKHIMEWLEPNRFGEIVFKNENLHEYFKDRVNYYIDLANEWIKK